MHPVICSPCIYVGQARMHLLTQVWRHQDRKHFLAAERFHLFCGGVIAGPSLVEEDNGLGQVGRSLRPYSTVFPRELEELEGGVVPSSYLKRAGDCTTHGNRKASVLQCQNRGV